MLKRSFTVILAASLLVVGGCTSSHPLGKPLPTLTFEHLEPLPVTVGALRTQDDVSQSDEAFVVSPHDAVREYLHARFVPKGFSGALKASIEEASVNHYYEEASNRAGQFLNVGGFDVYDMKVRVRLDYIDADERIAHTAVLNAGRVIKVTEHTSIAERERRQFLAMEALFADLDGEIRRVVIQDMRLGMVSH